MYEHVEWEVRGNVGLLTLNRPETLNAIHVPMIRELRAVIERAEGDPSVRAVVVTAAGRGFCSGADLEEWSDPTDGLEPYAHRWTRLMHGFMRSLYWLPKPVIAAVNGVAVGAGLDLALACDFRFASSGARFGEVYTRVGLCPDVGGSFLLPRLIGETRAMEMIYSGRIIDAAEALDISLVSEVTEPEGLMDRAMACATDLAAGPTAAIGQAKLCVRQNALVDFDTALRHEDRAATVCAGTADSAEGLAAATEKRPPVFTGK